MPGSIIVGGMDHHDGRRPVRIHPLGLKQCRAPLMHKAWEGKHTLVAPTVLREKGGRRMAVGQTPNKIYLSQSMYLMSSFRIICF